MRSYSNFLLFNDFLEYLPDTSGTMVHARDAILSPRVNIVEEDCGTYIGKELTVDFTVEGDIELGTDLPLTKSRIEYLLSIGTYKVKVRSTSSCTSTGGICKRCYLSTFQDADEPAITDKVVIHPEYNLATQVLVGDGERTNFTIAKDLADYSKLTVIHNGMETNSGFYFNGQTIIFDTPPDRDVHYVLKHYKMYSTPLLWYFSRTHSASLFGIKELQSLPLHLREGLYNSIVSNQMIELMMHELKTFKAIPKQYLDYCGRIHAPLEKVLFILYIYSVYASIAIN